MDMTLVVGLGNPGRRYANTRHNVGFRCVDVLAARHGLRFDKREGESSVAVGQIASQPVALAMPQTFMNLSGRAVRMLLSRYKLKPQDVIVVYDDMDLPLGRIRLREKGSAGGHRGVQSIIDALATNEFRRVRIGIGRPVSEDPIEYVLRPFRGDEEPVLRLACDGAADAIECILVNGISAAMNIFNRDAGPQGDVGTASP